MMGSFRCRSICVTGNSEKEKNAHACDVDVDMMTTFAVVCSLSDVRIRMQRISFDRSLTREPSLRRELAPLVPDRILTETSLRLHHHLEPGNGNKYFLSTTRTAVIHKWTEVLESEQRIAFMVVVEDFPTDLRDVKQKKQGTRKRGLFARNGFS